ncbi:MAG: PAS domain S-box protein [Janthinobacterium lividum]
MQSNEALGRPEYAFLSGGGELARIIVAFDWASTPLGPIDSWPVGMRSTVALLLRSPVPIVTMWGEAGIMIYNDAYSVFAGARHPQLLGSRVREGWDEISDFNDNVMRVGLAGGTLAYRDQELTLLRSGVPEPVWMDLDYSPIVDEHGKPVGVIAIVVETTAKVRAERWLSGERERLRHMFEQAPGFMAMLSGPEHIFELTNPAYATLVGNRPLLGRPVREALPEISGQGFFELLDNVYNSGEAFSGNALEILLQRTPGAQAEERYVDALYQPVKNEAGEVIAIFVQGTDVTDRVVAEAAVRESEARFRALAQAVPNHVWAAPASGELDWFNDRVYEYSGARPGDLDAGGWTRLVHPQDVDAAAQRWRDAVAGGGRYETEFRIRRADGVYRWHLVRAFAVSIGDGQNVRWIGTNTDIEDQKAAVAALAHLNATLEQQVAERTADRDRMWRLSTDIMMVADFNATILALNPAWTKILGWDESELLGRSFMEFVHPKDREATLAEVGDLSQGERTMRFENRYQRKDGGYCVLSWTAVPDNRFIHAVGRDVTADHEAAAALRRTEVALQQAQKMETIGKLTGGVAHDFNNLLQVISGNLQLLSKDVAGSARAERWVSNALAGVNRGAKLASHLLAFGRRQALEPKIVKIGRFVVGMEDMLRRSLGEAIEIETIVSGGLWNTFVDPAQVENALLNLAINARDAMNGVGRLTIEVGNAFLDEAYARTHVEVKPGQYVMLAVTDTGSGMSPEVLSQAFEPFFSTKPEGKGTGLGLSMVYGFVKQSEGHVKIYSEVGYGTTVKLYLPRTLEREDLVGPVEMLPVVGGEETILVAEDDEEVRETVVEMLSGLGYRVLKANDAAGALTIIDSGIPIDMLFTDVVMPGPLRSPDLARKARERLPHLAVLFTSGYTENAIVHGGRLDAGVELLSKPYTSEALARKVRQVLGQQAPRPRAARDGAQADGDGRGSERAAADTSNPSGASAMPFTAAVDYVEAAHGPSLKVLLVEDDELIRSNTAELLLQLGHSVLEAADGHAAISTLSTAPIDVLITDLGLPGMSGQELARRARQLRPHIGVVFASGSDIDPQMPDVFALRKPYDSLSIEGALRAVVARSSEV